MPPQDIRDLLSAIYHRHRRLRLRLCRRHLRLLQRLRRRSRCNRNCRNREPTIRNTIYGAVNDSGLTKMVTHRVRVHHGSHETRCWLLYMGSMRVCRRRCRHEVRIITN